MQSPKDPMSSRSWQRTEVWLVFKTRSKALPLRASCSAAVAPHPRYNVGTLRLRSFINMHDKSIERPVTQSICTSRIAGLARYHNVTSRLPPL